MTHSTPIYTIFESNNVCLFAYKIKEIQRGYIDSINSYDELKFVRITNGSGIWNINGLDHPIKQGDIIIFSRADIRSIREITSDAPLIIEQATFFPITIYPWQNCADFFFVRPVGFSNIIPTDNEIYDKINTDFLAIKNEITSDNRYKNEFIVNMLTRMVIHAARLYPEIMVAKPANANMQNNQYQVVCNAIAYINSHLNEDLSRPILSKKFWVSPSHFSRIFKEYSGFCLQDYIVRCRVTHTINLIRKKNINVLDAALESGFSSSSGFYRAFHATTGMKPGDLKKNIISSPNNKSIQ